MASQASQEAATLRAEREVAVARRDELTAEVAELAPLAAEAAVDAARKELAEATQALFIAERDEGRKFTNQARRRVEQAQHAEREARNVLNGYREAPNVEATS